MEQSNKGNKGRKTIVNNNCFIFII